MRLGLQEANQKFSKAVKAVKAGQEVILTERGKPIAVIKPLNGLEKEKTTIRRLEAAGLLRAAVNPRPMPLWKPRRLKGEPLSKILRDERDAS
ncbi:MAG: type II toxin-antitoxin system Phd/YefM family antitoxin [Nitrospiraceae bacterium]